MSIHDDTRLQLTQRERNSDVWNKLRECLDARLAQHRAMNDCDQPADATAMLRGRIAELKAILAMAEEE